MPSTSKALHGWWKMAPTSPPERSRQCSQMRQDAALLHALFGRSEIELGMIHGEVEASTLLPHARGIDHELSHRLDVPKLQQIARHQVLPVVLPDLLLQQAHPTRGALQAIVAAHDTDVVPHQAPNLVPNLGDDDGFVAGDG